MRDTLLTSLEPQVEALGLELVDLDYAPSQGGGLLRLYIDRPGSTPENGVTVDDCETVSRHVSEWLDEKEPIAGAYTLEVSSPGFDRPLRLDRHFAAVIGERMKVELSVPQNGRRRFTGVLMQFVDGCLHLEVDGQDVQLRRADVSKARLAPL